MSPLQCPTFVSSTSVSEEPLTLSEPEEDIDNPEERLLLRPTQPLSATCSRPPCLKRGSGLVSSSDAILSSLAASVGTPSVVSVFSFDAPRIFVSAPSLKRQVTFDASPPEAFITFHPEDYDRSQIECTQGGSDLDLRLPTKCKRYDGEGVEDEEEASEVEEDDIVQAGHSRGDGDSSTTRWACLRSGSVVGCVGGTLATGVPRPPVDPSAVSLPVHGFKSFGGFGRHTSVGQSHEGSMQSYSSLADEEDAGSDVEDSDNGAAALEAAALAFKSPNITPRPSPRIVPRWAKCTDYFESVESRGPSSSSPTTTSRAGPSSEQMNNTPPVTTASGSKDQSSPHDPQVKTGEHQQSTPSSSSSSLSSSSVARLNIVQNILVYDVSQTLATTSRADVRHITPLSSTQRPNASKPEASPFSHVGASLSGSLVDDIHQADIFPPCENPKTAGAGIFLSAFTGSHSQESSGEICSGSSNNSSAGCPPCHSSPSPMSSRCSSADPWSSLGSEDEGAQSPPHGGWSSSTSPDLTPLKAIAVADTAGTIMHVPSLLRSTKKAADPVPHQALPMVQRDTVRPAFLNVPAADDADVYSESLTLAELAVPLILPGSQGSDLVSALNALEARLTVSPLPALLVRSGSQTSGSSCISSSCTSTDEEGCAASPLRLSSRDAAKPRRKSSLLSSSACLDGEWGCSEGRKDRRSPRSSSSSRKSSISISRDEEEAKGSASASHCPTSQSLESEDPTVPHISCSRKRTGSKGISSRSGSGSSSTRSGSSGRIRLSKERQEPEFEDEGALGGF